jgi:hypothetical protein
VEAVNERRRVGGMELSRGRVPREEIAQRREPTGEPRCQDLHSYGSSRPSAPTVALGMDEPRQRLAARGECCPRLQGVVGHVVAALSPRAKRSGAPAGTTRHATEGTAYPGVRSSLLAEGAAGERFLLDEGQRRNPACAVWGPVAGQRSLEPSGDEPSSAVMLCGREPVSGLVELVRLMILRGEVPAGGRMVELLLAERFGTSLAMVREALRQLEGDGRLIANADGGMRVVELREDALIAALQVRAALEELSAGLAAERLRDGRVPAEGAVATERACRCCRGGGAEWGGRGGRACRSQLSPRACSACRE